MQRGMYVRCAQAGPLRARPREMIELVEKKLRTPSPSAPYLAPGLHRRAGTTTYIINTCTIASDVSQESSP